MAACQTSRGHYFFFVFAFLRESFTHRLQIIMIIQSFILSASNLFCTTTGIVQQGPRLVVLLTILQDIIEEPVCVVDVLSSRIKSSTP